MAEILVQELNCSKRTIITRLKQIIEGNLLKKNRQVISSASLKTDLDNYNLFLLDWTSLPSILDNTVYEVDQEYDALNRVTKIILAKKNNY